MLVCRDARRSIIGMPVTGALYFNGVTEINYFDGIGENAGYPNAAGSANLPILDGVCGFLGEAPGARAHHAGWYTSVDQGGGWGDEKQKIAGYPNAAGSAHLPILDGACG